MNDFYDMSSYDGYIYMTADFYAFIPVTRTVLSYCIAE